MKKMMVVVLSGFLFLALTPLASFADPCGCGGPGMGRGMGRGMEPGMHRGPGRGNGGAFLWMSVLRLDLSDKQRDALAAIRTRAEKESIRKRADLELGRVELRELLASDSVDMKAVEANLKKAEALRTDLRLSHIRTREEVKAQLTAEQRAKLQEDFQMGFGAGYGQGICRGAAMPEAGGRAAAE